MSGLLGSNFELAIPAEIPLSVFGHRPNVADIAFNWSDVTIELAQWNRRHVRSDLGAHP